MAHRGRRRAADRGGRRAAPRAAPAALALALALEHAAPAPAQHPVPAEVTSLDEGFGSGFGRWAVWGDPLPLWLPEAHGRSGVLDNHGDGMHTSGLTSASRIRIPPAGCTVSLEIHFELLNPAGCWLEQGFVVTSVPAVREDPQTRSIDAGPSPLRLTIAYQGDACFPEPTPQARRFVLHLGYPVEGAEPFSRWTCDLDPAVLAHRWFTFTFRLGADRRPVVWIDGERLSPADLPPMAPAIGGSQQLLVLGRSRANSAGRVYVDRVTFAALEDAPASAGAEPPPAPADSAAPAAGPAP